MKSVLTQEWVDDELGHGGRIVAYSLHASEEGRNAFVREEGKVVHDSGRLLRPVGRSMLVGVDEDVFERVQRASNGIWYQGKIYWGGRDYDAGSRSL